MWTKSFNVAQEEVERQRRIRVAEEKQAKSLEEEFRSIRIEADRAEARKEVGTHFIRLQSSITTEISTVILNALFGS